MNAPFNQYSCCKKCGASSHAIGTRWVQLAFTRVDAIRRTCGRCGFVWDETPLDSPTAYVRPP